MIVNRLNDRLRRDEKGFTLIELLVVIIIIGILLAIAVPSYLSFRDRATDSANKANLRSAVPAVEAYAADNNGTATDSDANSSTTGYTGMTSAELREIDAGLSADVEVVGTIDEDSYCIEAGTGSHEFYYSVGGGRTAASPATVNGVVSTGSCD